MKRFATPAALATALALFAGLGLAGCAPVEAPIPTEEGPGGEVPEEPTEGDGDTDGGLTTDVGGDCLVGDWMISESELQRFYAQIAAESDGDMEIQVSGFTSLDFTATSYEYLPEFSMVLQIAGNEATADVSGSVRGNYTATEGVVTTVNDVSDMDMQLMVNGMEMDGSDVGNEIISEHPINSASYRCEAGAPVINFETVDSTIPITLTAG